MAEQDKRTALIHHPYRAPAGFESPAVPVAKGSTVFFPNVAALRERTWVDRSAYTYGLHGTPTSFTLEERLATLEGGTHCMLVSSGLAAITLVDIALLCSGDQVLAEAAVSRRRTGAMPVPLGALTSQPDTVGLAAVDFRVDARLGRTVQKHPTLTEINLPTVKGSIAGKIPEG